MNWRDALRRTSLILGLVSLALASSIGVHFQHVLDDGGGRHVGEVLVSTVLAVTIFMGSWYGAQQAHNVVKDEAG